MPTASQIAFELTAVDKTANVVNQAKGRLQALSAPAVRLNRAFDQLAESSGVKTFARGLQGMTENAGKLLEDITGARYGMAALAGGLSAAGMAEALKHAGQYANNLHAISVASQTSVPQLYRIGNAAALAGGNFDQAVQGVADLNDHLQKARHGLDPHFTNALAQLFPKNFNAVQAEAPAKALQTILTRLSEIQDPVGRAFYTNALGLQAFTKEIQDGRQKFEEYNQEAAKLTPVSNQTNDSLNTMNEALNRLGLQIDHTWTNMEGRFAPAVTDIANRISDWSVKNPQLTGTLEGIGAAVGTILAGNGILRLTTGINLLGGAVRGLSAALPELLRLLPKLGPLSPLLYDLWPSNTQSQAEEDKQLGGPMSQRFPNLRTNLPTGPRNIPLTSNLTIDPLMRGLMDTIAAGESSGSYNPPANPNSTAHGRYQTINATDLAERRILGLPLTGPLTPDQQDLVGKDLMIRTYRARTGRDLEADLRAGGHVKDIARALNQVWPSLPGGSQSNQTMDQYKARLAQYTKDEQHTGGVPTNQPPLFHQTPPAAPPTSPVAPPEPLVPTGAGTAAAPATPATAKVEGGLNARIRVSTDKGTTARVVATGNGAMKGPPQVQVMPSAGSVSP